MHTVHELKICLDFNLIEILILRLDRLPFLSLLQCKFLTSRYPPHFKRIDDLRQTSLDAACRICCSLEYFFERKKKVIGRMVSLFHFETADRIVAWERICKCIATLCLYLMLQWPNIFPSFGLKSFSGTCI
jgi:hypothetical protein